MGDNNQPFINAWVFLGVLKKKNTSEITLNRQPSRLQLGGETLLHATASAKRDNPDRQHLQNTVLGVC